MKGQMRGWGGSKEAEVGRIGGAEGNAVKYGSLFSLNSSESTGWFYVENQRGQSSSFEIVADLCKVGRRRENAGCVQ